jgi:hypothetical protein
VLVAPCPETPGAQATGKLNTDGVAHTISCRLADLASHSSDGWQGAVEMVATNDQNGISATRATVSGYPSGYPSNRS